MNEWFFRPFRLLCIVVCCFGLCSIVLGCVNLVWICFLSSMTFSKFQLFQMVSVCFRVCCFLMIRFEGCVTVLHVFGCFEVVLVSDSVLLGYRRLI